MVSHWFTTKGACPIVYHTGNLISVDIICLIFIIAMTMRWFIIYVGSVLYKLLFLHQRILLVLFVRPLQLLFKSYSQNVFTKI